LGSCYRLVLPAVLSRADESKKWQDEARLAVGEEAEIPDAHETFGKHVQQEAAAGIHREKESSTSVRCCEQNRAAKSDLAFGK